MSVGAYFPPYEEVPDSAFKIAPEIEKKLEGYKFLKCHELVDTVKSKSFTEPPKTMAEQARLYQGQNPEVTDVSKAPKTIGELLAAEQGKPYQRQNSVDIKKLSEPKHAHYFKDVSKLHHIDVYRVLSLFNVTDPCLQHAVKKLLVAGGRGAKDMSKDVAEAIDTLKRWQQMQEENLK